MKCAKRWALIIIRLFNLLVEVLDVVVVSDIHWLGGEDVVNNLSQVNCGDSW